MTVNWLYTMIPVLVVLDLGITAYTINTRSSEVTGNGELFR